MTKYNNPKKEYHGNIEDYPLENYPDYEPGKVFLASKKGTTFGNLKGDHPW